MAQIEDMLNRLQKHVEAIEEVLARSPWEVARIQRIENMRSAAAAHVAVLTALRDVKRLPATCLNPVERMYLFSRLPMSEKLPQELTDKELLELRNFGIRSLAKWRSVFPKPEGDLS